MISGEQAGAAYLKLANCYLKVIDIVFSGEKRFYLNFCVMCLFYFPVHLCRLIADMKLLMLMLKQAMLTRRPRPRVIYSFNNVYVIFEVLGKV